MAIECALVPYVMPAVSPWQGRRRGLCKRPRPVVRDRVWCLLRHGLFSLAPPRSRATTA